MKTLILYASIHHGNTGKVAKVIASSLGADLLQVQQADTTTLDQYDLIGFGSGIYFGRHHKSLFDFIDGLPAFTSRKAFIFATSGIRKIPLIHDFDKPLAQALRRKGFKVIGEFSCRGYDTSRAAMTIGGLNRGRPNDRDLQKAENFARALQDKMLSSDNVKK